MTIPLLSGFLFGIICLGFGIWFISQSSKAKSYASFKSAQELCPLCQICGVGACLLGCTILFEVTRILFR